MNKLASHNLQTGFQMRKLFPTEILYLLITKPGEVGSPLFPPKELNNFVVDFLQRCPKDLIQLKSAVDYYELSFKYGFTRAYNFEVLYDLNVKSYIPFLKKLKQVKVIFIDKKSPLFNEVINDLKNIHTPLNYYFILNAESEDKFIENQINSPYEFIAHLIENQNAIVHALGYLEFRMHPSIPIEYKKIIDFKYFIPTRNNYFMINTLIGNFHDWGIEENEEKIKVKTAELGAKAIKSPNSFQRQQLFLDQIQKLDYFNLVGLKENLLKNNSPIDPQYTPLILVAPFHNPDVKQFHRLPDDPKTTRLLSVLQIEQTENYVIQNKDGQPLDGLAMGGIQLNRQVLHYIDSLSFLHASFCFSPVVRLPWKGKSIYRELSFFRTSAFGHLSNPKNRKSLNKTIERFGAIFKEKTISKKLENVISQRNSQVVIISDLPLEWLSIENVPFAFTHDICRLPTTSLHSLMAVFARSQKFEYIIPKDIVKKTLVVFGSSEPQFMLWQNKCRSLSVQLGFNTVHCNNISEVKDAVTKFDPELLIFDCHGSFDSETHSTYLWIGDEKLTGDEIVNGKISAPLVFLSACGTAPTYGTINNIANAFFETGCLSVTTTYLPIEIHSSSLLYLRLLNNLSLAAVKGLHKNWLSFLGHMIRTSTIMDRFRIAKEKTSRKNIEEVIQVNSETLLESMVFEKRRNLYHSINETIENISGLKLNSMKDLVPEYLFYSNLGRSDLVYFESWLEKFRDQNQVTLVPNEVQ